MVESERGRLLTILLAPLAPCAARLAIIALLVPAFFGRYATLVSGGLVAFNLLTLALIGILINRVVFGGERMAFIMELPLHHVPNVRTIGLFVWHKTVVPALQVRSGFYSGLIAFTAATVFLLAALLSPRR